LKKEDVLIVFSVPQKAGWLGAQSLPNISSGISRKARIVKIGRKRYRAKSEKKYRRRYYGKGYYGKHYEKKCDGSDV